MSEILTRDHPRYEEFYDFLCGPEACDFQDNPDPKKVKWTCHNDKRFSKAIIEKMGGFDVEASVKSVGGGCCCDCEITFNRPPVEK